MEPIKTSFSELPEPPTSADDDLNLELLDTEMTLAELLHWLESLPVMNTAPVTLKTS